MTQRADHVLTGGGIEVQSGLLAKEAEAVHADFLFRQRNGRPKILAKMAVTLDGCAAKLDGSSKWITGFLARTQVHTIRSQVDAILTSTRTMLVDRARYNVRHVVCSRDPDLIVLGDSVSLLGLQPELDREGIVFFHTAGHRTDAPTLREAKVTKVQGENGHAYPTEVAKALSEFNYNSVLLEAGPQMLKSFDQSNLIDELTMFISPKIFGTTGLSAFNTMLGEPLDSSPRYAFRNVEMVGEEVRVDLYRRHLHS